MVAGDACCEIIFACGLHSNTLTFDAGLLDCSGHQEAWSVWASFSRCPFPQVGCIQLQSLGAYMFFCSPPEHLISIWLSCSVLTCLSIITGKVMLPKANCLTGFPIHFDFIDLFSHRTAGNLVPLHLLQEEMGPGCCTHQLHNSWKNKGSSHAKSL